MALFTIGDPHLSLGCDKPMDIFAGWEGYLPKLEQYWRATVAQQDTVVLAGDISWAMKLTHTVEDFAFLHSLPGRKIMLKGNHDLWWETLSKMEAYLAENGFDSLCFLHNNFFLVEGVAVCGSRGWMSDKPQGHDAKMIAREAMRLRASLQMAKTKAPLAEPVVFLHFPPFYSGQASQDLVQAMQEYGVKRCYYGHLHSSAMRWAVEGEQDGILYKLVSADKLGFVPLTVETCKDRACMQK